MILYCTSDLIFSTKIRSTAESIGLDAKPVKDMAAFNARNSEAAVSGLIVDLDTGEVGLTMLQIAAAEAPAARKIAFGPHVDSDLLQRARGLGADEVLTRGRFTEQLPTILQSLADHEQANRTAP